MPENAQEFPVTPEMLEAGQDVYGLFYGLTDEALTDIYRAMRGREPDARPKVDLVGLVGSGGQSVLGMSRPELVELVRTYASEVVGAHQLIKGYEGLVQKQRDRLAEQQSLLEQLREEENERIAP